MKLSRDAIQRMVNVGGGNSGGGGGLSQSQIDAMLAGYAQRSWVDKNYLSIEFFSSIFRIHSTEAGGDDDLIEPNSQLPQDTSHVNIEAMFGFWTDAYVSALGKGTGGGDMVLTEPLSSINLANLGAPTTANVGIVWNGSKWVYGSTGGSGTVTAVKVGTTTYNPSSGVVSLPAYLPLAGGTMSNTNLVANLNAELLDGTHKSDLFTEFAADGTITKITIGGTAKSLTIPYATSARILFAGKVSGNYADANTMRLSDVDTEYSVLTNYSSNSKWQNMPSDYSGYGGLVEIKGLDASLKMQLAWSAAHNDETSPTNGLWFRARANIGYVSTDWHRVAFTDSNVASATKLQTARTIWGQNFDGTANVSGAITGATTITASSNVSVGGTLGVTGASTLTGLLTANGGITIPSGKTLTIGDAVLSWDATNKGIKITKGLYSETFISALGTGSSSGTATTLATLADVNVTGAKNDDVLTYNSTTKKWEAKAVQTGTDMATVWTELGASTTNQINASHLTDALGSYAQKTELTKYLPLTAGANNRITGNTYISRPVSTRTAYTETDSRIYYTTPDSIDEILLMARIRNNGTNNYYRVYYVTPFSSITSNDVAAGTQGYTILTLGNANLITAANSRCGYIRLYGTSATDSTKVCYGNIVPTVFTANRTYTLPNATGTIALTSDLGGYLPLTGGTLTGKLTINHNLEVSSAATFQSGFHIGNPNGHETQLYTADNLDGIIIKPIVSGSSDVFQLKRGSNGLVLDFVVHDSSGNSIGGLNMLQLSNASNWNFAYGSLSTNTGATYINGRRVVIRTSSNTEEIAVEKDGTVNIAGNVSAATFIGDLSGNADSATKLQTSRTIWGRLFDGTANVSGDMSGVGDISFNNNARIHQPDASSSKLYIGNATNNGWVMIADMCSQSGNDKWQILDSGNATFANMLSNGYVTALSDIRKKEIKGDVGLTVEDVANAPSVRFLWKDKRKDGIQVGSIAQYWQKVLPEAVIDDSNGVLSMSYGVIALLASIATARKVQDHERRISELESENKQLKRQLEDKCQ